MRKNKATALSAFEMYEFHGTQQGTMIQPGQTLNLDYSLTRIFPVEGNLPFQLGLRAAAQCSRVSGKRDVTGAEGERAC